MKAFIQHLAPEGGKIVLQALVRFIDLKDTVVFTSKTNLNKQLYNSKNPTVESLEYYQRRIDLTRISDIENFIINSILDERNGIILATLFPSSMILAVNDEENIVNIVDEEYCDIDFQKNVFIVDGQHRMLAMLRVYNSIDKNNKLTLEERTYVKNYIESYKFNCTVLVNYDLWEQGQVFINVNFKQKPVNKSLYYEIFGSVYRENKSDWRRNKIYLAHCLAKVLNDHEKSPFKGRVKMLGTGTGYISQAFVVEALLPLFSYDCIWELDTESDNFSIGDYSYFSTELVSYFNTLYKMFKEYWPEEGATKGTLICKTTGFGALCRLMGTIRSKDDEKLVRALKLSNSKNEVCSEYTQFVEQKLSPLLKTAESLFGKESKFAQNTGKAAETKLYKQLLSDIQKSNNTKASDIVDLDDNDVDSIYQQIQDYLWGNIIEDLDRLAHHYEVEDVSDFNIKTYQPVVGGFKVECSFNINVNLFMDNEDENGFVMGFPATLTANFDSDKKLDEDSLQMDVNTDKYYD